MTKGIFVSEKDGTPYAQLIVQGRKNIETRSRKTLSACVGDRIAIIATRKGKKPVVIGFADVLWEEYFSAEYLDVLRFTTCIPKGSKYDVTTGGKWSYYMAYASVCDPFPLPSNAIRHGRSWCEFNMEG